MSAKKVLILSGRGRYADPWHDHAAQAHAFAEIVTDLGCEPTIRSTFYDQIPDFDAYDLVIVNASRLVPMPETDGTNDDWMPFHEALAAYAKSGKPLLAFHTSVSAFEDSPYWPHIVGGRWIRPSLFPPMVGKTTHHPKIDGEAEFVAIAGAHPIVDGLETMHAVDERYSFLFLEYGVQPFLKHWTHDVWHACGWVNEQEGMRVVYHAPGHTAASMMSVQHRDLLEREIRWLLQM